IVGRRVRSRGRRAPCVLQEIARPPRRARGSAAPDREDGAAGALRIAISTGGGDAPGLNAVIRGAVLAAIHRGWECVGIRRGYDVGGTQLPFGFDSAVQTGTEAIDKVHSTAESHERVMVVEVMGRHAGWIALHSGISGSADVILMPEIPFDMGKVCEKIARREAEGRHFSIVVVAEGAAPRGGSVSLIDPEHQRLGGIGDKVAHSIQEMTGKE